MNKWKKYLSVLLAMLFIVAGTIMVAYADETPDEPTTSPTDEPISGEEPTYVEDPNNIEDNTEVDSGYDGGWDTTEFSDWSDYSGDGSRVVGSVDVDPLANTKELSENDVKPETWSNISISQKELKEIQEVGAAGSFKELQKTPEDDGSDEKDDGGWILWLGYGLIVLAVLCIIYFIVSTVNAKKQAERERRHNSGSGGSGSAGGSRSAERRSGEQHGGHYADGYDANSRRGSKANTGEVYIPRRAVK